MVYLNSDSKQDQLIPEVVLTRLDWQHLQNIMSKVQALWDQPDRLKGIDWANSECPWWDFKQFHEMTDLRQNFLVLKCLLNNKTNENAQVKSKSNFTQFSFTNKNGTVESYFLKKRDAEFNYFDHLKKNTVNANEYLPFDGIRLEIGKKGNTNFSFSFTLFNDQKLKFLPQANYFYGQDINQLPHQHKMQIKEGQPFASVRPWDNVGRYIVIDKLPVRNFELELWDKSLSLKNKFSQVLLKPELPVTYLSQSDQELYCQSRGMQLIDAAVFDAATFYRDIRNYQEEKNRSLFYFGNRWPLKNKCQLQKTQECRNEKYQRPNFNMQISWMGLLDFSNEFESMKNIFNPQFNLHPGSKYFKEGSAWQFLANRLQWDGAAFAQENFKWVSSITGADLEPARFETNLPIQFRCMKEWVVYP